MLDEKKKVTILVSETFGWHSKAIQGFSGSDYSHSSLSIDGVDFYTFNFYGFRIEHPHKMTRKCHNVCIHIDVTEEQYESLKKVLYAIKEDSDNYCYSLLGIILSFLHIPYQRKNKYFCSQFVAEMLASAGIAKLKKKPALYLPKHLLTLGEQTSSRYQVVCNAF